MDNYQKKLQLLPAVKLNFKKNENEYFLGKINFETTIKDKINYKKLENKMLKTLVHIFVLLIFFDTFNYVELKGKRKHQNQRKNASYKRHDENNSFLFVSKENEPDFGSLIHGYSNVTSILGQPALLNCAVRNLGSFNILWLRVKDGDVLAFDDMLITQDSRFRLVKKSHSESNLIIHGVRSKDAGEYACQINTPQVKSKFINLIVFG